MLIAELGLLDLLWSHWLPTAVQEVAVDYNKHAHGRYRVCREGDKLEFGSFVPVRWEIPLEEMDTLFMPKNDSFALCSGKSLVEVRILPLDPASKPIGHGPLSTVNCSPF